MEWVYAVTDINQVASEFWEKVAGKTVIAFHGQMGAGKTTFIHALCAVRKVLDVVGSPTFSIINEYRFVSQHNGNGLKNNTLFHLDLYRIKDEEEAQRAGVEDVLYSGQICLVEWPEKAPGIFPADTLHVYLELVDSQTRRLRIADI